MKMIQSVFVLTLAATSAGFAQVTTVQAIPALPAVPGGNQVFFSEGRTAIVAGVTSFDGKVVKGQPYTADAVTETNQVLSDGNRISRTETASVARDSEGRTRHEEALNGVGPWATSSDDSQKKIVFINDPVAQVNYVLEPNHVARKMPLPPLEKGIGTRVGSATGASADAAAGAAVGGGGAYRIQTFSLAEPKESKLTPKVEQLGTQTIDGVQAEGTRTTITIPAGQIGNEKPINMVSERWYSSELQTAIMTKSSDPRTGETTFRLTNIQRSEPAASLFEVPSDYKIEEGNFKYATTRLQTKE